MMSKIAVQNLKKVVEEVAARGIDIVAIIGRNDEGMRFICELEDWVLGSLLQLKAQGGYDSTRHFETGKGEIVGGGDVQ